MTTRGRRCPEGQAEAVRARSAPPDDGDDDDVEDEIAPEPLTLEDRTITFPGGESDDDDESENHAPQEEEGQDGGFQSMDLSSAVTSR